MESMKIIVFWDMTLYSFVGSFENTWGQVPQDSILEECSIRTYVGTPTAGFRGFT
jgi:hypothetical protein